MARESCKEAISTLPPGSTISVDGAWDHRRNGQTCITSVFCPEKGKLVDYQIERADPTKKVGKYTCCPTNLEVIGVTKLIPRLREHPEIVRYVHDNDAKTRNVIRESGWDIEEKLDPGHALKSFMRILNEFQKGFFNKDLCARLSRWMNILIGNKTMTPEQKGEAWLNTINHLTGDHTKCPFRHDHLSLPVIHPDDDRKIPIVKQFLDKTLWIATSCDFRYRTQQNEAFNGRKLGKANKDVHWGFSFDPRMGCAVLDVNSPNWIWKLFNALDIPEPCPKIKAQLVKKGRPKKKYVSVPPTYPAGPLGYRPNPYHPE
jgi:hypothetical protein